MLQARTLKVAVIALLLHGVLLVALQSGLAQRAVEQVLPVEVIAQLIGPAAPRPAPSIPTEPVQVHRPTPPSPSPVRPTPIPAATTAPILPPSATAITTPAAPVTPAAPQAPSASPAPVQKSLGGAPKAVGIGQIACDIPEPVYPSMSKRNGEEGKVMVRITLSETGQIEKAVLAKESGSPRLDQAALDAAQRARCKPYSEGGQTMRVSAVQPYVFKLD